MHRGRLKVSVTFASLLKSLVMHYKSHTKSEEYFFAQSLHVEVLRPALEVHVSIFLFREF